MTCTSPRAVSGPPGAARRPVAALAWLECTTALAWLSCAPAQAQPQQKPQATAPAAHVVADARIETLDRAQAEQARLKALADSAPKAYEDRFMTSDADTPAADATPESEQPQGYRAWLVESRIGFGDATTTGYGRQRATEFGQRFEYRRETLNYGEFVLQADGRHLGGDNSASGLGIGSLGYAREATSGRFTLRNLGFPLTTQTFADTAVGDIQSELTGGLARNYRLSLGSTTVRGASMRVYGNDFDLRGGFGQRGNLTGGPYPGFEKSQGTLGWLGATLRLGDPWFASFQLDRARNVPAYYYDPLTARGYGSKDVTSWASSVGWGREVARDGDFKARATLVGSRVSSSTPGVTTGDSRGLFVEASARTGLYRHEFGAYTARPNLYFGDYALATGTRGAYWRVDRNTSRLSWGVGLDYERSRRDVNFNLAGYRRFGASGNFQYLFDRDNSVGGSLSVYRTRYDGLPDGSIAGGSGDGRSLYGSAFWQTRLFDWPRSRFSLTVRRNELIVLGDSAATGQELQWEQDWIGGRRETMRPELTTTVGYARDRSGGTSRSYPTAGLQLRYWIDDGFHVGGNLRYTSQSGGLYTSRGLSGSLTAEKELGMGWRVGFMANFNQARASLLPTSYSSPNLYRSNEKAAYVYLRWEGSAGTAFRPAGARGEGAGGGSVSGRVFYDANRDGEQQSGEGGVAGVEVLLDGRYRATTDRDGRFEFPLVTTGRHQLTLTLESVPLPWGAAGETGVSVNVPLRGRASAEIPVVKVGE
nr:SdrD B-like domain-containing protein [Variovorax sp. SG517]